MKTSAFKYYVFLLTATLVCGFSRADDSQFVPIFDGATLEGWAGQEDLWRVESGEIVGETTTDAPLEHNSFLVWQGDELADFELKLQFKIPSGNSGVQYRSTLIDGVPHAVKGYQADISADGEWTGAAYNEKNGGIIAHLGQKIELGQAPSGRVSLASLGVPDEIRSHIRSGDWNEYHIIAYGNHCIQKINGAITAEFIDKKPNRISQGLIALQLHAGPPMQVRFRDIRLRKLEPRQKKRIVFLAGARSHGHGAHEHHAGCQLLAKSLHESGEDVVASVRKKVVRDGPWPIDAEANEQVDAIVMYCDGAAKHMAVGHQDRIQALVDQGIGVACLHFGVEVEKEQLGPQFLDWIGGYFEIGWSVNPHWEPKFEPFPDHPIANGVQPFSIRDEWYYHIRFRPQFEDTVAILSAVPPIETLQRERMDARATNPTVQRAVENGESQVLAWAYERPNGGRGFGFTGGHFHRNWAQDDFRKLVLNALVWTAKGEVPEQGIDSLPISQAYLALNQDFPPPKH